MKQELAVLHKYTRLELDIGKTRGQIEDLENTGVYVCMYICMCVYLYVCMYICMYVCYMKQELDVLHKYTRLELDIRKTRGQIEDLEKTGVCVCMYVCVYVCMLYETRSGCSTQVYTPGA